MAPHIVRVDVTKHPEYGFMVNPIWSDVDRPDVGGYAVGDRVMVDRLVAAMLAGAVYPNPRVVVDNYGQTFVQADHKVMGKYMNADLKRLGF